MPSFDWRKWSGNVVISRFFVTRINIFLISEIANTLFLWISMLEKHITGIIVLPSQ
jgi:hypothetical protein